MSGLDNENTCEPKIPDICLKVSNFEIIQNKNDSSKFERRLIGHLSFDVKNVKAFESLMHALSDGLMPRLRVIYRDYVFLLSGVHLERSKTIENQNYDFSAKDIQLEKATLLR